MSVEHPSQERLSELVDGDLSPELATEVSRHVETCVTCRADVARLRELVERAARLPAAIDPPEGAWTAVRVRLQPRPRVATFRGRGWVREWGLRAAAVLVLVAGSSAVTVLVLRSRDGGPASGFAERQPAPVPPTLPASVVAVERSYAAAIDDLTQTLRAQRGTLAPSTVATLERTLRVIDAAIAEARAALAADPRNDALLDVLSANYEQKVQLLRRASELPARS